MVAMQLFPTFYRFLFVSFHRESLFLINNRAHFNNLKSSFEFSVYNYREFIKSSAQWPIDRPLQKHVISAAATSRPPRVTHFGVLNGEFTSRKSLRPGTCCWRRSRGRDRPDACQIAGEVVEAGTERALNMVREYSRSIS